MIFRKVREKTRYEFRDRDCLWRPCFVPGMYQHRSPSAGGGSRNTGSPDSPCCLTRAYHGCPASAKDGVTVNLDLLRSRKREGWRGV